jgi:hypothetical protein
VGAEGDVADNGGVFGDEDIFAEPGLAAEKFVELGLQVAHADSLAEGAREITREKAPGKSGGGREAAK